MGKARFGVVAAIYAILAAIPSAVIAEPPAERLASPALPGFVVGHTAANDQQSIKEEIPRGETVEAWSRMVTTQWFAGLTTRATPADFARNVVAGLAQGCPGAKTSPIISQTVSGRAAVRFQADCPRNSGGQAETFLLLAVAGRSDLHVKQVAFRGAKSAAALAWARDFLSKTALCTPNDRTAACGK